MFRTVAAVVGVGLLCAAGAIRGAAEESEASLPRSTWEGRAVSVGPNGPSFEIPASWTSWYAQFRNNLHGTREELAAAKAGGGEWDREYAEVMNAILDHGHCGFQGGGDGWGDQGASYADLQLRVYVWPQSVAGLAPRIEEQGARAVAEILRPTRKAARARAGLKPGAAEEAARRAGAEEEAGGPDPSLHAPESSEQGGWHRRVFRFPLSYGDYGAQAHVDVRMRDFGSRALVFVFCYTDFKAQEDSIAAVLESVKWSNPPMGK